MRDKTPDPSSTSNGSRARSRAQRGLAIALFLALSAGFAPAQEPETGEGEAGGRVRLYSIPETRDARALMRTAGDHIRARRYDEAIASLQRLTDVHRGDVLPARSVDSAGRLSIQPFHSGAAAWAAKELCALPPAARARYRERYEKSAQSLFASARASGERRALVEVAVRWPLTDAAERAWWTLGDIEIELGNVADARRAWLRASEIGTLAGRDPSAGYDRRLALVEDFAARDGRRLGLEREFGAELRAVGPDEGGGPVPEDFADAWTQILPRSPYRDHHSEHNLFPVLSGDQVFVSNGWQVFAFDAYTGRPLWESAELPGWVGGKRTDLVHGIDVESVLVAPSVSGSVVVAPLQVAHSRLQFTDFQGIRITVPIPERRLFAFDRATGELLWDHAPPPLWDGESGTFSEQMIVAGPPVVGGSRVLVPCYLMQGRVDFHVACYDLASGDRLWSTQLVSGQRELNMFGRPEKEFCAPPLRLEGDRAIVLTQLGTVAALDLYTGEILWQSLYEQEPLPATRGWKPQDRDETWRNAPPVVADGLVVATPADSHYLVAFDLAEGTAVWQYPHTRLVENGPGLDTLLGADDDALYFGGAEIAVFHAPGGLAGATTGTRFARTWNVPVEGYEPLRSPRAVLTRDEIVLATHEGRLVLDKRTGLERRKQSLPWIRAGAERSTVGNMVVGSGMLFTANAAEISGLFDWSVLESRALDRIAADPEDVSAMLTLAQVREQHGVLLYESGDVRGALDRLREARRLLEPRLGDPTYRDEVAGRLHRVLRISARAREGLADVAGALELLELALPLAHDSNDVRDTLLEREAIVRDRDRAAWLETLEVLGRRLGDKPMPREAWALAVESASPSPLASIDPELLDDMLPIDLWVLLVRANALGRWGEVGRELEDLHACLARHGSRRLAPGRNVAELVSARIEDALARGGTQAYEPFERRAREMMDLALLESGLESGSDRELEAVRSLYPHSEAAREAGDHLLDRAFAAGDAARVCRLVNASLARTPELSAEDARRLVLLGEILGGEGNVEAQRGILESVLSSYPDLVVEAGGRRWAAAERLARLPPRPGRSLRSESAFFDGRLAAAEAPSGSFVEVGYVPPGPAQQESPPTARLALLCRSEGGLLLQIHGGNDPVRPDVRARLRDDGRNLQTALSFGRVVIANGESLVAVDAATGEEAWPTWRAPRGFEIAEIRVHEGVLVVLQRSAEHFQATAFDVHRGRELWNAFLPRGPHWRAPLFDGSRAVFLTQTQSWELPARALVVDLHRGASLGEIDLGGPLTNEYESAFVSGGMLVLPAFQMGTTPDRNRIRGFDLDALAQSWTYDLRGGRELEALFQVDDETYLVVTPGEDGRGGAILGLEPRLGATRSVMELSASDRVLGAIRPRSMPPGPVKLDAPFLFFYSSTPGLQTTRITAVHLPYGKRWSCLLRVPSDDLFDVGLTALPAVSTTTVAVVYTKKNQSRLPGETYLTLIDKESGMKRLDAVLPTGLGRAADLRLLGLGNALFLLSRDGANGAPLEIWENR